MMLTNTRVSSPTHFIAHLHRPAIDWIHQAEHGHPDHNCQCHDPARLGLFLRSLPSAQTPDFLSSLAKT